MTAADAAATILQREARLTPEQAALWAKLQPAIWDWWGRYLGPLRHPEVPDLDMMGAALCVVAGIRHGVPVPLLCKWAAGNRHFLEDGAVRVGT